MTLAILQARTSSTRLPGKVLKQILGRPMLALQLERNLRSKNIDKLVVATSDRPDDQPIADLCEEIGVECFRGSLNDVLDRYYQAALKSKADHIVRLTGDCPVADPVVIDRVIEFYHSGDYDYVSNIFEPTFPHGLDVEVFRFEALKTAWQEATLPAQREHVAPFIWRQPDRFKLANFKHTENLSHHRWTVDEPEDFELITAIYEGLYPTNPEFDMEAIVSFLNDHPDLQNINRGFHRNTGLLESLKADGTVVTK